MESWHYFDRAKRQRQAKLAYRLIQNKEKTQETEFIWSQSLLFETGHSSVSKMGFKVLYKKSKAYGKNRIYFMFVK